MHFRISAQFINVRDFIIVLRAQTYVFVCTFAQHFILVTFVRIILE